MRGHTAFLTFATAGLKKQPNPNEKAYATSTEASSTDLKEESNSNEDVPGGQTMEGQSAT